MCTLQFYSETGAFTTPPRRPVLSVLSNLVTLYLVLICKILCSKVLSNISRIAALVATTDKILSLTIQHHMMS